MMENSPIAQEKLAPNMTLHSLNDGQIVYFTIGTVARSSWDAWARKIVALKDEWPVDRPFLTLQDSLFEGAAFTSTIRKYLVDVSDHRPELTQYMAIVLPRTIAAQMVELFLRSSTKHQREIRVFFNVDEGLAWLESKL